MAEQGSQNRQRNRLQRIVQQQLNSWQQSGVTYVPTVTESAWPLEQLQLSQPNSSDSTNVASNPAAVAAHSPNSLAHSQTRPPASALTIDRATATKDVQDVAKQRTAGTPDQSKLPARSKATIAERREELDKLAKCVAKCVRCPELASTRTQTVFGVGNPKAKIMYVGEAPGADEDRLGEPFVGRAGKLLDKIIEACNLKREEIYICNILRCRPPGNRNPSPEEAGNCREYLDGQIAIVDPDYIVCWGSVAAKNLLETTEAIGKMRGQFFTHGRAKVLCTYHPSYLLRNPPAKKDVWEDMKFLMRDMGVVLD